jgi:hypothetical protein
MHPKNGQFKVEGKTPWPTPIGMGALADPEDFAEARKRDLTRKTEQEAVDRGDIPTANEMLSKKKVK